MSNQQQQQSKSTGKLTSFTLSPCHLVTLSVFFLLSACAPNTAQPIPTHAPAPTFTPTIPEQPTPLDPIAVQTAQAAAAEQAALEQQAQPTSEPQGEPEVQTDPQVAITVTVESQPTATVEPPTATPAPANPEVVVNSGINVRQGPGTNYAVIGAATTGQRFPVTGKNQTGDWWQINYNGQAGWVFGQLVTTQNTQAVVVAQNIPAPPPPTNTPVPPPPAAATNTPAPVAQAPAPAPQGDFPFLLLTTERCEPNAGQTYMNGFVRYKSNALRNAVCVHLDFYGPRTTKCSGCDGVGDGNWGFSPFSGPAPAGTTVEIWVVQCPSALPLGGQNENFTNLTPLSPKWKHTFNTSEQCTGITFVGD